VHWQLGPQASVGLSLGPQVDAHEFALQPTMAPLHVWLAEEQEMSHGPLPQVSVAFRHA
jgi:hypothetical protein